MTNRRLVTPKNPLTTAIVRGFGAYMPDNLCQLHCNTIIGRNAKFIKFERKYYNYGVILFISVVYINRNRVNDIYKTCIFN